MSFIYLASPYTHSDPAIMEYRFKVVCRVAARLMREGNYIFSPIAHTHPIAVAGDLPKGWEYWSGYDKVMIRSCNELWILEIPGWQDSKGITAERKLADYYFKTVRTIAPTEDDLKP